MKRITALFLSILLLLSLCVTALGHEAPDLTKKGTITIQWKFQGDALPDGALRAYRVGTLKDTDGNFSFAPLPAYQGKDLSEKNLTPELAKELAGMVKASSAIKPASFKNGVVTFDELESTISADGSGVLSMPTDYRTKRQKGDDYPLAAASGIKKGWTEQADAFADYLKGMTAEKVAKLETEEDGKPKDADLLSSCTIAIDGYRDAVAKACANAEALGAAKGDRVSLGIEAANASSDVTATDDKDVNAQVDVTIVALTTDSDGRVTSAIGDMAEPALTVMSDGNVMAPDTVKTKLEQGDSYGMRGASSLGKEWYEHSEGFCSYLKGKTAAEIAKLPADGSDADLAALCTIDVTDLQKAAAKALEEAK